MSVSLPADSLESLLNKISIVSDDIDHESILKQANNVLKSSKGDLQALHIKVVALLYLDRHEEALRIFDTNNGKPLQEIAVLEWAYCLYKVGQLEKAIQITEKAIPTQMNSRAFKHIAAQAYYRLENFEETAKICSSLVESQDGATNEQSDLRVNSGATDAQLAWSGKRSLVQDKHVPREDLDVFEATFNAACFSIAKGEYNRAKVLLQRAKHLCNDLEDLTEKEKLIELEPVTAQEVYVLSRIGQSGRALDLIKDFDSENVADDALKVISEVNRISVMCQSSDYNPYLSWKNYNEAVKQAGTLAARPFGFQSLLLNVNEPVMDIDIGKTSAAAKKATEYKRLNPKNQTINVITAAAKTANMDGKEATKRIEKLFVSDEKDVGVALTFVQLRMNSGDITGSISILETLFEKMQPEDRYKPGLVGLVVALLRHQGRKKDVRDILTKASEWWVDIPNPNPPILRAAGKAMLESDNTSDHDSASKLFSSLIRSNSLDRASMAGYVASLATTEPSKVTSYVDSLTPVEKLISGIDVNALENAGVAQPPRKRGADENLVPSSRQTKPRKKSKLPKNFDPSKKIDPERWLRMRDRSYYKPKGRKDKKKTAALTQGGPVEESMELAGGGRIDVVKVDQSKKPGGGAGGGANKKKKKKGGKW